MKKEGEREKKEEEEEREGGRREKEIEKMLAFGQTDRSSGSCDRECRLDDNSQPESSLLVQHNLLVQEARSILRATQ